MTMMETLSILILLAAQDAPKVDPVKVDQAIERGVQYLKSAASPGYKERGVADADELILWTFLHAGVSPAEPRFQEMFRKMIEGPLERTYKVSLQAMILEEMDREAYLWRIAQCAVFLADNQCKNGQWSYGIPVEAIKGMSTGDARIRIPTASKRQAARKPAPKRRMVVRQTRTGPATGDNSNSQYAALGLRACHDAGIGFDPSVVTLAQRAWKDSQCRAEKKDRDVATAAGLSAPPAGWCYCETGEHAAYGSMTAGAVAACTIYDYMLGQDWRRDPMIHGGLSWLVAKFSVRDNVGPCENLPNTQHMYYYYLYALERACILYGTEFLGSHEWYSEGANVILSNQRPDGSWKNGFEHVYARPEWDTCFAILFLKRATRELAPVASTAPPVRKDDR